MTDSHEAYRRQDKELIEQFRESGDLDVLGRLYERYMHLVYGVCLKYLKDREESRDATMQIFEVLMDKIPRQAISDFKAWLYVLTKNHCLMLLRSKKSQHEKHKKLYEEQTFFMESGYEMHLDNEPDLEANIELLKKCIEQLKSEQQECVKLFYLSEKPYREIADSLGIALKTVKSHIQNGKRNLKNCMENHG